MIMYTHYKIVYDIRTTSQPGINKRNLCAKFKLLILNTSRHMATIRTSDAMLYYVLATCRSLTPPHCSEYYVNIC